MALAVHYLQKKQLKSQRSTATVYRVAQTTLQRRITGIQPKQGS
jgi:hypothetical protein